jgi:hypothetical protein
MEAEENQSEILYLRGHEGAPRYTPGARHNPDVQSVSDRLT